FLRESASMTAIATIVRKSRPRRVVLHTALLASASVAALLTAAPDAHGRSPGGWAPGPSQSAVMAAQQAAQDAARAAQQAGSSLKRAMQATQAMQAAQTAARNVAIQTPSNVPNGLTAGGLLVAPGAGTTTGVWVGAELPTQAEVNGRTQVDIRQT